ncbi:MAG TPA: hypothetical protein DCY25_03155, partial [Bacteroidales bacterium]|nr:hypothetical protein [Bacteroidales bacterium]
MLAVLLPPSLAIAQDSERIIIRVILNEENKGEYFAVITQDGDILMTHEDVRELGMIHLPHERRQTIDGKEYISLMSLSPEITFHVDEKEAILRITAKPELFQEQTIDLMAKPYESTYLKFDSAFLNYSIGYDWTDNFHNNTLSIPFELGASINEYVGLSSFAYSHDNNRKELVRLMTSITKDDRATLRRYIVGDFPATS